MSKIMFRKLTENSENMDFHENLYVNSFPAEERPMSISEFVAFSDRTKLTSVSEIYDEDEVVGFIVYATMDKFVYGLLVVIKSTERGKGIGSRAIKEFLIGLHGKPMIFVIEKPNPEAANNVQRIRRQALYERLGMYISDITVSDRDVEYLLVSSEKDIPIKEYFDEYYTKITGLLEG